jgi:hypothetical protein
LRARPSAPGWLRTRAVAGRGEESKSNCQSVGFVSQLGVSWIFRFPIPDFANTALPECFLQPLRNDLRHSILRAHVKVVAVGHDDHFALASAVFGESFGGIIFFRLLVAADEEDGAFDSLGVLD